ncbi:PEP-CTERM sorting domain-containing protein [Pelomonas sp. SE-A7]|uniref:PEP-CTERM sorting domain-containing protein n=1 Tax=Pelomonas sp. SE-A7 TaxID=3054953 RepID=UPI00259C7FB4|nr:PEP-CTERM sorting domain-containing protein [Pelomonas sp. SE-A7]MDM4765180.1 PEP-CTERM sorting domain-containing protein [Pelomonas sp. SE-A7]
MTKSLSRLLQPLALAGGLLIGGLVTAAPVVTYSGNVATGVQHLDVGGTSYNVSFVFGSYNSVFGVNLPSFLGNALAANDAANALVAVLDAESAAPLGGGVACCGAMWLAFADNEDGDTSRFTAKQTGYQDTTGAHWQRYGDFVGGKDTDFTDSNWGFAVFQAEDGRLPEPGALVLTGLALAGLAWTRRRRLTAAA